MVITNRGEIKAEHIVSSNSISNYKCSWILFLRMHQERDYVIALKNAQKLKGIYRDENEEGYSFRNYKDLLILTGGSVRTELMKKEESMISLENMQNNYILLLLEEFNWSAQDCMTSDYIPFIGDTPMKCPMFM